MEPLAIHYKWYAWYLFAYSEKRQAYRTYKIARMRDITIEERKAVRDHGDIRERMKESEKEYYRTCIAIEIHFHEKEANLMEEFFPDCAVERPVSYTHLLLRRRRATEKIWVRLSPNAFSEWMGI